MNVKLSAFIALQSSLVNEIKAHLETLHLRSEESVFHFSKYTWKSTRAYGMYYNMHDLVSLIDSRFVTS